VKVSVIVREKLLLNLSLFMNFYRDIRALISTHISVRVLFVGFNGGEIQNTQEYIYVL
jgi:hypothetical protein